MQGQILIISTILIIVIVIVVVTLQLIRKKRINKYMTRVRELERDANLIASTPVLLELSKVEAIINNERHNPSKVEIRPITFPTSLPNTGTNEVTALIGQRTAEKPKIISTNPTPLKSHLLTLSSF